VESLERPNGELSVNHGFPVWLYVPQFLSGWMLILPGLSKIEKEVINALIRLGLFAKNGEVSAAARWDHAFLPNIPSFTIVG